VSALPDSPREDLSLLAAVLVWGVNFPVLKVALGALEPHVLNAARFTVSALVLGVAFWWRTDDVAGTLATVWRHRVRVAALGVLGYFLFPVAFLHGVDATTAGNAALIMASAPLWTALLSSALGLDGLGRRAWAGLLVAGAGTVVVVVGGAGRVALTSETLLGNALVAVAAALWGAYTVLNRPVLDDVEPLSLTLFGLLAAFPLLHALAVPGYRSLSPAAIGPLVWGGVLYAGALATGLAFVWWNSSVRSVGPARTGVYNNLVPVVGLAGGALVLGERVGAVQLAGAALILGGVLVVRLTRPAVGERHDEGRQPI
jgi:drug/metabolite transporter (DMT)-like permease